MQKPSHLEVDHVGRAPWSTKIVRWNVEGGIIRFYVYEETYQFRSVLSELVYRDPENFTIVCSCKTRFYL